MMTLESRSCYSQCRILVLLTWMLKNDIGSDLFRNLIYWDQRYICQVRQWDLNCFSVANFCPWMDYTVLGYFCLAPIWSANINLLGEGPHVGEIWWNIKIQKFGENFCSLMNFPGRSNSRSMSSQRPVISHKSHKEGKVLGHRREKFWRVYHRFDFKRLGRWRTFYKCCGNAIPQ